MVGPGRVVELTNSPLLFLAALPVPDEAHGANQEVRTDVPTFQQGHRELAWVDALNCVKMKMSH